MSGQSNSARNIEKMPCHGRRYEKTYNTVQGESVVLRLRARAARGQREPGGGIHATLLYKSRQIWLCLSLTILSQDFMMKEEPKAKQVQDGKMVR